MQTKPCERELPVLREHTQQPTIQGDRLEGWATKYGQRSKLINENGSQFFEIIDGPNCFDLNKNITFVYRHDDDCEFGDTKSGTLKLEEKPEGLWFSLALPPYANSLRNAIETSLVGGMSFSFYPRQIEMRDGIRHVKKAELLHISAVWNPAYETGKPVLVKPEKPQSLDFQKKKLALAELK